MNQFTLSLRSLPTVDVDASVLTDALQPGSSEAVTSESITRLPWCDIWGHPAGTVGDYFDVKKIATPETRLQGDLRRFHQLAAHWSGGRLNVEGQVGSYFAFGMRGGELQLQGDAGDHCGSQMRGGRLTVEGNVGDYLAGPSPGVRRGMAGGELVVKGDAGIHAGHRMRRGLIVIQGNCADAAGSELVAGTLVINGRCGQLVGVGMRRGTIVCQATETESQGLRFTHAREQQLTFARLLAEHLQTVAPEIASRLSAGRVRRSVGDLSVGGQGELWWL